MGNGTTRVSLLGQNTLAAGVLPSRTPGTLGRNDVADPGVNLCPAGDTPGCVGLGSDQSSSAIQSRAKHSTPVNALFVSLEGVTKFLYSVSYVEAMNQMARVSISGQEVDLGREADVVTRAQLIADRMTKEFMEVLKRDPAGVTDFLAAKQEERQKQQEAMQRKFAKAVKRSQQFGDAWNYLGKLSAMVRFETTVALKVMSAVGGGLVGTAIELTHDAGQAGVEALFDDRKKIDAVVISDAAEKELWKFLKASANEKAADKALLNPAEKKLLANWLEKYRGDRTKLLEQLEHLERRARNVAASDVIRARAARAVLKQTGKLRALHKKMFTGVVKKGAGKIVTFYFLKQDIEEAWKQLGHDFDAIDGFGQAP